MIDTAELVQALRTRYPQYVITVGNACISAYRVSVEQQNIVVTLGCISDTVSIHHILLSVEAIIRNVDLHTLL